MSLLLRSSTAVAGTATLTVVLFALHGAKPPSCDLARRTAADYDADLRYADHLVGSFVAFLEARGLLPRTLLVATSDHGTEFGEHGRIGHARSVYEEQVRVPLVISHPRLASGGRRVGAPVGLTDLAPTFLEIAGAEGLPNIRGISLVPLLGDGEEVSRPRECRGAARAGVYPVTSLFQRLSLGPLRIGVDRGR